MAGEVAGNQQLPAEVLELVFRQLEHADLATLLLVCRFWAEVAERPKLWVDFRLAVTKSNHSSLPRLLGLRRLRALTAITVAWPPDTAARAAITAHPAIVALTYRSLLLLLLPLLLSTSSSPLPLLLLLHLVLLLLDLSLDHIRHCTSENF